MDTRLAAAVEGANREEAARITAALSIEDQINALCHYCEPRADDDSEALEHVRLLLDAGCPTHDANDPLYQRTPLHLAAWFGYADIAALLIERGAPINLRDSEFNSTPIRWALFACRTKQQRPGGDYARIARILLDHGAVWTGDAFPTGDPRIDSIFEPMLGDRFEYIVARGDSQQLEQALAIGPSQDELDLGLCIAAQKGMAKRCTRLMRAGAVVGIVRDTSWIAINAAVWSKDLRTLKALLEGGADVHTRNIRGGTIWHALGEFGASRELIDVVVKHGGLADINVASKYGYTALDLAIVEEHTNTIDYLISLGAEASKTTMPE